MAIVQKTTGERIHWLLDDLLERWEDIPRVAREIGSWDLLDQLDFTEHWLLHYDKLKELRGYAQAGKLTDEQRRRYDQLEVLVRREEPTLMRLLH